MRIILAEDDPISRRLLEANLTHWGYEVVIAEDGDAAWRILTANDAPRLALMDWMMPGIDGVEICRRIRRQAEKPYIYIILLTALQHDEDLIMGMEAGADDYVTKPFIAQELKLRLRAGRRIIELQNELIQAREALKVKATRDSLTGLWNHEEILQILDRQLSMAQRENGFVSALMADLDHFKKINDTYGHMAGDAVLRETSKKIVAQIRPYDAVGRYGGEEFLLVLPNCDKECALNLAERLRSSICREKMDIPDGSVRVSISIGIASIGNGKKYDADAFLSAADTALYQAKKNGRNRVEVA